MSETVSSGHLVARRIADRFGALPGVEAIALGGSHTSGTADPSSDIDLYVYTTSEIPLGDRLAIIEGSGATQADLDMRFWDLGDEWYDTETGIEVDIIYWDTSWIEDQLDRVLVHHQASTGYTTCFWYTVRNSVNLYDRNGWLHALKENSEQAFPEELRRAIISKNHPILRRVIPAYLHQIEKAIQRADLVSMNHRVAALLASYFDVLFALNRVLNPGEKRVLTRAAQSCAKIPEDMCGQVQAVLRAACAADRSLITRVNTLVDGLDCLLLEEGFDPDTSLPLR